MEETTRNRVTAVCVAFLLIFIFLRVVSCGVSPSPEPGPTPTPTPTVSCGGLDVGDTKVETCAGGAIVSECKDTGLVVISNTCTQTSTNCTGKTTFEDLKPVIAQNCAGCHSGYDSFSKASSIVDAMIKHINIPAGQPDHMPAGKGDLSKKDKDLFAAWKNDGKLEVCQGSTPPPPPLQFHDFGWVEKTINDDLATVPVSQQEDVRYIIAVDRLNQGDLDGVSIAKKAINKASNSVSLERKIEVVHDVAPGVWRLDIDELGIESADWTAIENASQLQFESFTQRGKSLKLTTKSRLPWMFVQDFNDTVLRNAAVYYKLTKAAATLQQQEKNLGVKFATDLLNFKALLVGFNGSPLSPAANRLMDRHDSNDGYFWSTFDTGAIVSDQQNLFKNPFPVEAGAVHNLRFAAGEQLYSLPNGLMGSYLADNKGVRLNQADPAVVHDFTANPNSPIIKNAISCFRCHNGGIIHATDKVRASVAAANLGAADTQRALALFKPQAQVDALIADDNATFTEALRQMGIDPAEADPINRVSDRFLGDLSAEDVAGLFVLTTDDLKTCIRLSPNGSQQASQLLTGGTISHDQFVQVVKDLVRDCRIFQDPLN